MLDGRSLTRRRAGLRLWLSAFWLGLLCLGAVLAPWIAPNDPLAQDLFLGRLPPAWMNGAEPGFYLGTDSLGRDVLSRILYGARLALTVALAIRHPDRVGRFVLMGAAGLPFPLTDGLAKVWGYQPSIEAMRDLMQTFAYDPALVKEEIVRSRYEASIRPGAQEAFSSLFPEPRQRWLDELAADEDDLRKLPHRALILHGRDDVIVPLAQSVRFNELIQDSDLYVFGQCGHWTQIEHAGRFARLVEDFLAEADAAANLQEKCA